MAALRTFRWLPKPPAMHSDVTSESAAPAVSSSVSMPAAMAALASCTARTSRGWRATPGARGSSSSSIAPVSSMSSAVRPAAMASMRPEPHTPTAGAPSMVWAWSQPLTSVTRSIAPGMLPQPQEMPAPSNAGPAAVEVTYSVPSFHSAISPLVPMSHSSAVSSRSQMPLASTAQVMSAPTNAFMHGGRYACPPKSGTVVPNSVSASNGARARLSGLRPVSR